LIFNQGSKDCGVCNDKEYQDKNKNCVCKCHKEDLVSGYHEFIENREEIIIIKREGLNK